MLNHPGISGGAGSTGAPRDMPVTPSARTRTEDFGWDICTVGVAGHDWALGYWAQEVPHPAHQLAGVWGITMPIRQLTSRLARQRHLFQAAALAYTL